MSTTKVAHLSDPLTRVERTGAFVGSAASADRRTVNRSETRSAQTPCRRARSETSPARCLQSLKRDYLNPGLSKTGSRTHLQRPDISKASLIDSL